MELEIQSNMIGPTLSFISSLTHGGALRWYYSMDPSKTKVWNELVELFVD